MLVTVGEMETMSKCTPGSKPLRRRWIGVWGCVPQGPSCG